MNDTETLGAIAARRIEIVPTMSLGIDEEIKAVFSNVNLVNILNTVAGPYSAATVDTNGVDYYRYDKRLEAEVFIQLDEWGKIKSRYNKVDLRTVILVFPPQVNGGAIVPGGTATLTPVNPNDPNNREFILGGAASAPWTGAEGAASANLLTVPASMFTFTDATHRRPAYATSASVEFLPGSSTGPGAAVAGQSTVSTVTYAAGVTMLLVGGGSDFFLVASGADAAAGVLLNHFRIDVEVTLQGVIRLTYVPEVKVAAIPPALPWFGP